MARCLSRWKTARSPSVDDGALWAVQVPFTVPAGAPLDIGTILDERPVSVPAGRYDLVFEAMPGTVVETHAYTMF